VTNLRLAFGIATVTILVTAGSGSAHSDAVMSFKGNGGKALPQFRVTKPSTMFWTNSGSFFQISSYGGYCTDGTVTSEAHRGTTYLPPGRYQALDVRAIGAWTITVRAGVEPVSTPITFSGSGARGLPPFRLRSGKTMYWTNTGTIFQTYPADSKSAGVVSSQQHRGKIRLPAGRYRLFVNAATPDEPTGSWRIIVR
jgi:hypothetical protein